jgi:hypothetical protein
MVSVLVDENGESKGSLPHLGSVFARNQFDEDAVDYLYHRILTQPCSTLSLAYCNRICSCLES